MKDTFKRLGPHQIDREVRACSECQGEMITRAHWAALEPAERRTFVRHGAHGVCTGCIDRVYPRERASSAVSIRREEWAFLKAGGVSVEEAARRLGVTPETIRSYDRIAA